LFRLAVSGRLPKEFRTDFLSDADMGFESVLLSVRPKRAFSLKLWISFTIHGL